MAETIPGFESSGWYALLGPAGMARDTTTRLYEAFARALRNPEVARRLADRTELTVVTNALNIAMDLVLRPRVKLVVVGGVSRPQSYELVGSWAEEVLAGVNIDGLGLVVYNAGMDPHEGAGGPRGITADTMAAREQMLFAWTASIGVPVAFALAGGYTIDVTTGL